MNTPFKAFLWELWRNNRLEVFSRTAFMCGCLVLLKLVGRFENGGPEATVLSGVFTMLFMLASAASSGWWMVLDSQQRCFSFRLAFRRPVSTRLIVGAPLLFSLASGIFSYAVPALAARVFLSAPLPLAGPLACICLAITLMVSASWVPAHLPARVVSSSVMASLILGGFILGHGISGSDTPLLMAMGSAEFFEFGWGIYALFPILAVGCYFATVWAVDRQRHGCTLLPYRSASSRSLTASPAERSQLGAPFRGRVASMFWYEYKRYGGRILIVCSLVAGGAFTLASTINLVNPDWAYAPYFWIAAIPLSCLVVQIVAADGAAGLRSRDGKTWYASFDATRPMRNDHMVLIKLGMIAICSTLGCISMIVSALAHSILFQNVVRWREALEGLSNGLAQANSQMQAAGLEFSISGGLTILAATNFILLFVSSSSAMYAFGLWIPDHRRTFAVLSGIAYAHGVVLFVDSQNGWMLSSLWHVYSYAIPVAIAALCGWSIFRALKAGFLHSEVFLVGLGLWIVFVASVLCMWYQIPVLHQASWSLHGLVAATLLVPLATTAFAPLALAHHRHCP